MCDRHMFVRAILMHAYVGGLIHVYAASYAPKSPAEARKCCDRRTCDVLADEADHFEGKRDDDLVD